jgi:hypothetical protein
MKEIKVPLTKLKEESVSLVTTTKSFCPFCNKVIDADVIEMGGKVYLKKECCGKTLILLKEGDFEFYKTIKKYTVKNDSKPQISYKELKKEIDKISTLAIHITQRCNTYCKICVMNSGCDSWKIDKFWSIHTFKKFLKIIKNKQKIIILSGGEPTVREDLPKIIKLIVDSGNIPYLFTNGIKLADYEYVKKLKQSGLYMIHFSLDSLIKDINDILRGEGTFELKMKALENIKKCGMKVYLSMTIIDGLNDKEIGDMILFAMRNYDFIRGIIIRPFIPQGRINIDTGKLLTLYDLVLLAESQTSGLINKDYLIEFRRFRFNIYKLIRRIFGKNFARDMSFAYFLDCIFKIKGKSVKPIISYEKLQELNRFIEIQINKPNLIELFLKFLDIELFDLVFTGTICGFNFSKILNSFFKKSSNIRITFSELSSNINTDASEKISAYTSCGSLNMGYTAGAY